MIELGGHLLNRAVEALLLLLLVVALLLECIVLELRTECSGRARLERRTKKQLGWEQGSELHIEGSAWSCHIILMLMLLLLIHRLRVDGRNVRSVSWMSLSVSH